MVCASALTYAFHINITVEHKLIPAESIVLPVSRHRIGHSNLPYHDVNDVVARAFLSADTAVIKEPAGLYHTDGKRPDGMSLIPRQAGKSVVLDVIVICITAASYVKSCARKAGAAAEVAAR